MKPSKADSRIRTSLWPLAGAMLLTACGGGTQDSRSEPASALGDDSIATASQQAPAADRSVQSDLTAAKDLSALSELTSASETSPSPVVTPDQPAGRQVALAAGTAPSADGAAEWTAGLTASTSPEATATQQPPEVVDVTSRLAAPPEDKTVLTAPTVDTDASARTLGGGGLRTVLAAGCTPRLSTDFIDNPTWNNRRLLPRDCALSTVDAPLFSWRQPPERDLSKPWAFKLRRAGGEQVFATTTGSPRVQLRQHLAPGDYEWDVSYQSAYGDRGVRRSDVRRFTVATDASTGC